MWRDTEDLRNECWKHISQQYITFRIVQIEKFF